MRRSALAFLFLGLFFFAGASPATACHFGGLGCNNPPEQQPFNPVPSVSLADNRTSAHSTLTYKFTQQAHEQFVVSLEIDFAAQFGIDLDIPAFDEKIADLAIVAVINGAQTTLNGRIFDHNDADPLHGHPSAGLYHWLIEVDSPTPGMPPSQFDGFSDKNAPDGHLHFEFEVSADLLANAMAVDASVLEVRAAFFGSVGVGPFLTNPAQAGTYTVRSTFTAWDDPATPELPPTKTVDATVTVAARVPTSVTVTPANQTLRVGATYTATATVLDQRNEALVGALVDFDVTAGPHAGAKCQDVVTGSDGKASCSYTEATGGTDTIRATATASGASASGTATVKWRAPTTLTLTPASQTRRVGETATLAATVRDQDGAAMAGESLTFTRTGANPGSASATTDAAGQATHSYSGANSGDDTVTASASGLSAQATVSWYVPAVTTVTLAPPTASPRVGQTHTVTATVADQQGRAMEGASVAFEVTGGPHAGTSGSRTTNAAGEASFSYTGTAEGTDTIQATAGGVSATAQATWGPASNPTPTDRDGDGIINTSDNCSNDFNPDQRDADGDHFGDVCDPDDDNDSLQDVDEAPNGCDPFDRDTDDDRLTDWQEVRGFGLPCNDPDADDDGASDGDEKLDMGTDPWDPDTDNDGVLDGADNCPRISNPDQRDSDGDGVGDSCDGIRICIPPDPVRCPM